MPIISVLAGSLSATIRRQVRFAADSPLEGDGFELPVPRELGLRRGRRGIEQFRTHVALTIQLGVGVEVAPIRRLLDVAEIVQIARGSSIRNTMLSVR